MKVVIDSIYLEGAGMFNRYDPFKGFFAQMNEDIDHRVEQFIQGLPLTGSEQRLVFRAIEEAKKAIAVLHNELNKECEVVEECG